MVIKSFFLRLIFLLAFTCSTSFAVNIRIDYSLDTSNFFNTAERRKAMEAVASFYSEILDDTLLRIDPSEFSQASWSATLFEHPATGDKVSFPNLVVNEDEYIVYVGARALANGAIGRAGPGGFKDVIGFQPWFDRISARGNAGALGPDELKTDFASWGGTIAFDSDTIFSFSLTDNESGVDFISIAMHEMGHAVGLGTANSWQNLINSSNRFTGGAAINSFGSLPQVEAINNKGHFVNAASIPSFAYGLFGTIHGTPQPALMVPTIVDQGANLSVLTDLDLAALIDIGWELKLPNQVVLTDSSSGTPTLSWNSSSFFDYTLERGTDLVSFPFLFTTSEGDGTVQSISDSTAPLSSAFYRLGRNSSFVSTPSSLRSPAPENLDIEEFRSLSVAPVMISCGCGEEH